MTKAEIILQLVLSLNRGDSMSAELRVQMAERQYNDMVARGIIKEENCQKGLGFPFGLSVDCGARMV